MDIVWVFHSCTMNDKINDLHERCMHLVYNDKTSSIHIRNLQILAKGILKVSKDLVSTIFSWLFSKGSVQYNLPHASESFVPNVKSTFHGRESLSYLGPKIWDLTFKKAIKKWKLQNYPCRVCKIRSKSRFYLILFLRLLIRDYCQISSPLLGWLGWTDWSMKSLKNQIISGEKKTDWFPQIRLMVEAKFGDNCKGFFFF